MGTQRTQATAGQMELDLTRSDQVGLVNTFLRGETYVYLEEGGQRKGISACVVGKVLERIDHYSHRSGWCFARQRTLASECRTTTRTLQRAFRWLEENGYILVNRQNTNTVNECRIVWPNIVEAVEGSTGCQPDRHVVTDRNMVLDRNAGTDRNLGTLSRERTTPNQPTTRPECNTTRPQSTTSCPVGRHIRMSKKQEEITPPPNPHSRSGSHVVSPAGALPGVAEAVVEFLKLGVGRARPLVREAIASGSTPAKLMQIVDYFRHSQTHNPRRWTKPSTVLLNRLENEHPDLAADQGWIPGDQTADINRRRVLETKNMLRDLERGSEVNKCPTYTANINLLERMSDRELRDMARDTIPTAEFQLIAGKRNMLIEALATIQSQTVTGATQ